MARNTPQNHTDGPHVRRVHLFGTCLVDQFSPQVGVAVATVLELQGCEVEQIDGLTCCGQPAFNSGFRRDAFEVAWRFVELLDHTEDDIVSPSGSCVAMVRNYYPVLFRDHPDKASRAQSVAARVYEFSEYLVGVLGEVDLGAALTGTAAYHKCCHLLRELHIDQEPQELLANVKGLELAPLERADVCCGFGGAFSVKLSEISTAMLEEKINFIKRSQADTVIAGDTGCIMHMQGGLRRAGVDVQVLHLAEVLAGQVLDDSQATTP